jgi:Phosphotransferase enzyme family
LARKSARTVVSSLETILGPPPGLPWSDVAHGLEEALEATITSVAHRAMGWKIAGAYRLWLQLDDGRSTRLVLKHLDYSRDNLPAASGLPFDITRTESLVYEQAEQYPDIVPRTYLTLDLQDDSEVPGALVVMEDLGGGWAHPRIHHAYGLIILRIDDIHRTMSQIASRDPGRHGHVPYDRALARPLAHLFEESVMAEPTATGDSEVGTLLSTWSEVRHVLTSSALPEISSTFVHGDLSLANIFIRWLPSPQIRLIDYEWMGFGFPHADLACLLKRARPSIERFSLQLYALRHRAISYREHKIAYEWSQICRGLLDATYLVRHRKLVESKRQRLLSDYTRLSLRRAWLAASRLKGARGVVSG